MAYRNARLTIHGRRLLVTRVIDQGRPVAHVVKDLGCSRATGHKWLQRWRLKATPVCGTGPVGLIASLIRRPDDRSPSLPTASGTQARRPPARTVTRDVRLTIRAILTWHGLHRLAWLDRPTGQVIRRYERDRRGELIHVDVKKLGRLRDGGGWRVHGRDSLQRRRARYGPRIGFDYVHCAVDDHSRLAYAEIQTKKPTPAPASCAAPPSTSPPTASPPTNG